MHGDISGDPFARLKAQSCHELGKPGELTYRQERRSQISGRFRSRSKPIRPILQCVNVAT
jgi:hypothetical protein